MDKGGTLEIVEQQDWKSGSLNTGAVTPLCLKSYVGEKLTSTSILS